MKVYPIKDMKQLEKFKKYIFENYDYKHYSLVVVGLNTALRISDILSLRWEQLYDRCGNMKDTVAINEKKTKKTRLITLNKNITEVLIKLRSLYPGNTYVFQTGARRKDKPWCKEYVIRYIKESAIACGIRENVASHTLRKTFAYHAIMTRKKNFTVLQTLLKHSAPSITLRYVCLDDRDVEVQEVYKDMNL